MAGHLLGVLEPSVRSYNVRGILIGLADMVGSGVFVCSVFIVSFRSCESRRLPTCCRSLSRR